MTDSIFHCWQIRFLNLSGFAARGNMEIAIFFKIHAFSLHRFKNRFYPYRIVMYDLHYL